MSANTKYSPLALFQEGLKMWEWLGIHPEANKNTYLAAFPDSPLRKADCNCAGCEDALMPPLVEAACQTCRLLTEEEKNLAASISKFNCCNSDYVKWDHYSGLPREEFAAKIADRHIQAIKTLKEKT